jgi:steroid 5-alpha reductase family enzyme
MLRLDPSYIGKVWPPFMWTVTIIAALGCCMGFKSFVWFMSVGYGFAVMCIGAFHLVFGLINHTLTTATAILSVLFIIYGYRLGGYILKRELTNKDYKKKLDSTGSTKAMPLPVSLFMWAYSMWMYTAQTSAVSYRIINRSSDNFFVWLGIIIMIAAIVGEATADKQKSAAKKVNPKRFCDSGLYRYVRCPNYFSEIMFWVGVTVSGIGAVQGRQWIMVLIALVLITFVMYNSAQRLELRHEKTYGLDPEYQKYSDTVPLLFPFTKQYHSMKVYRD